MVGLQFNEYDTRYCWLYNQIHNVEMSIEYTKYNTQAIRSTHHLVRARRRTHDWLRAVVAFRTLSSRDRSWVEGRHQLQLDWPDLQV